MIRTLTFVPGNGLRTAACILGLAVAQTAPAADFRIGDVDIRVLSRATIGAQMRVQGRSDDLLGKLNVPGQQGLCVADDCFSLAGDFEPNQRLIDARGGFFLSNADDGNMNYDRGDVTQALTKFNSRISVTRGAFVLRADLIGYYDPINTNFSETKFDTRWQPERQPRSAAVEREYAMRFEHRELFASYDFILFDRFVNASIGWQRIRWGEANLHLFNTIDVINPLDAVLGRQPGLAIAELNIPVNVASLSFDLPGGVDVEAFYQLRWRGARPEPAGSFLSVNDIAGFGQTALVGLGQFSEDPFGVAEWGEDQAARQFTSTTKTVNIPDPFAFRPRNSGQWGIKLSRFFMDLNGGTEIALHYQNLHSRLPLASAIAADRSCARDVTGPANTINVLVACGGTTGEFGDILPPIPGVDRRDPLPVDTLQVFLEYPENEEIFGVSFNTPFGRWGGYGEYTYRPRAPLQILLSDLVFAGLQPAAPPNDFPLVPLGVNPGNVADIIGALVPGTPLEDLAGDVANLVSGIISGVLVDPDTVVPGARRLIPDFISEFRGVDIEAGDYVPGFHRTGISQAVVGATRLFSTNPFGSEDVLLLLEAGMNYIHDMPDPMTELPLQGAGDLTHPSPGADGSGVPEDNTCPFVDNDRCATLTFNPTQQRDGFATRFSWGVRSLVQLQYPNFIRPGITLRPEVIVFYDVNGISGFPAQNFVEGNLWLQPGLRFEFGDDLSAFIQYQHFRGSRNLLRDRDHINLAINYDF